MTRPTKQPTAGRTVNLDYAANPPVFYANFSHVHMTPFDCQLVFGDITEANQAGINAKVTVRIAMSPEHAGVLLPNL